MENLLQGAYDLHIHCGPDIVPRSVTGLEMAKRAEACGMKGFAIKAHYDCTCQQAALINSLVPAVNVIGTLTMNSSTGGINPMAVETAARTGAGIIWCPTFDSASQQQYYLHNLPEYIVMQSKLLKQGMNVPSYCIIDNEGNITKDMSDVLEIVTEYKMVLATGHITHEESFALAREAHRRNFRKLLITHADWSFTHYSIEEKLELVSLGAKIEHTYTSPAILKSITWEESFNEMRIVGPEHIIISTDLGQAKNEFPDEGLKHYAMEILKAGFSRDDLSRMLVHNPAALVEEK